MAPDLPDELLGVTADDSKSSESTASEDEAHRWFVFVGIGEHELALPVNDVKTVTEVPEDLTRVPRSPPAIEGVTDLRGEITVVIDPSVHFSVTESRAGRERLVVFDRPSDQQPAAMRVDDVIGVESIPEGDIVDEETVEERDFSGRALEHPLIVELLEQEHEPDITPEITAKATTSSSGGETDVQTGSIGSGLSSVGRSSGDRLGSIGETFTLEEDADETEAAPADENREIHVEVKAVLDVETLLAASGHNT